MFVCLFFTFYISVSAASDIAELSIFSDGTGGALGAGTHSFIALKNISGFVITIGTYDVDPDDEITVGIWGNKLPHKGLWYNMESYFVNQKDSYTNRVSLSMNIDNTQLETITEIIKSSNRWSCFFNCTNLAAKIWNAVSSEKLSCGFWNTPSSLANSIKSYEFYETGKPIKSKNTSNVIYVYKGINILCESFS